MEVPESGACFKCGAECDSNSFCFGCEEFICDDIDCSGDIAWSLADAIGRGHDPDDHYVEANEGSSFEDL